METSGTRDSGFTIVEILIVLSIIALLLVVLTPTLSKMQKSGEGGKAKAEIQKIRSLVATYASNPRYGDFPSTDLKDSRLKVPAGTDLHPNDVNLGIESLVLSFSHSDYEGTSPFSEDRFLVNTDDDAATINVTRFGKPDLFEYSDPWGTPYVYFRLKDFDARAPASMRYRGPSGDFEASPVVSEKTGVFAAEADGFQLISCGPDGEFGTDDDIASWK